MLALGPVHYALEVLRWNGVPVRPSSGPSSWSVRSFAVQALRVSEPGRVLPPRPKSSGRDWSWHSSNVGCSHLAATRQTAEREFFQRVKGMDTRERRQVGEAYHVRSLWRSWAGALAWRARSETQAAAPVRSGA